MSINFFHKSADDILKYILEMPFIVELGEGILPREKFDFFILQDTLYLKDYSKGFRILAQSNPEYQEAFMKTVNSIDEEVVQLTAEHSKELQRVEQSSSNLLYTSYLLRLAYENNLLCSLAGFYSCAWIYYKVGKALDKKAKNDNPYLSWIRIYSSKEFGASVRVLKEIASKIKNKYSAEQQTEAIECFRKTCKMEYMFWDSAYRLEGWIGQEKLFYQLVPKCVLSIAGSDSSGGAGIQADLNTFHSHQVYGTTCITTVTAQNSQGVHQVSQVKSALVKSQITAVVEELDVRAIKIGMLYDEETIHAVSEAITQIKGASIVVDPVMISTSGHQLLKDEAVSALAKTIFPHATVVTPNIDEAVKLLSMIPGNTLIKIASLDEMINATKLLADYFKSKAFLIKGGHLELGGKAIDVLYDTIKQKTSVFERDYIKLDDAHGTGCTLSAAIASCLAKGYSLESAILVSKNYVHRAMMNGFNFTKSKIKALNHFVH